MSNSLYSDASSASAYRTLASGASFYLGIGAAFFTVCIWACWLVLTKLGTQSALTSFDLALLRYGLPSVVLLPFVWRARRALQQVPLRFLLGITCGAGVPFFFLSAMGMTLAPASHAGLLIPGTFPLFVTGIAFFIYKEPLTRLRLSGLISIFLGISFLLMMSVWTMDSQIWLGDLYLLGASVLWAIYTISLRVAGLPPLAATGLLGLVSMLLLLICWALAWVDSGIGFVSTDVLFSQFFVQAILVGLVTGFSYGFAIQKLGAERSAAMGALTPVLTSLLAIPLLGESLTGSLLFGLLLVSVGVVFASGFLSDD